MINRNINAVVVNRRDTLGPFKFVRNVQNLPSVPGWLEEKLTAAENFGTFSGNINELRALFINRVDLDVYYFRGRMWVRENFGTCRTIGTLEPND